MRASRKAKNQHIYLHLHYSLLKFFAYLIITRIAGVVNLTVPSAETFTVCFDVALPLTSNVQSVRLSTPVQLTGLKEATLLFPAVSGMLTSDIVPDLAKSNPATVPPPAVMSSLKDDTVNLPPQEFKIAPCFTQTVPCNDILPVTAG
jgi:hypothetical protein